MPVTAQAPAQELELGDDNLVQSIVGVEEADDDGRVKQINPTPDAVCEQHYPARRRCSESLQTPRGDHPCVRSQRALDLAPDLHDIALTMPSLAKDHNRDSDLMLARERPVTLPAFFTFVAHR
jgi:hypothetical protein